MKVDYFKFIWWLLQTDRITAEQYKKNLRFIRSNKLQSAVGKITIEYTNIKKENGKMFFKIQPTLF